MLMDRLESVALLYLQGQDLTGKSLYDLLAMYDKVLEELKAINLEASKKQRDENPRGSLL